MFDQANEFPPTADIVADCSLQIVLSWLAITFGNASTLKLKVEELDNPLVSETVMVIFANPEAFEIGVI